MVRLLTLMRQVFCLMISQTLTQLAIETYLAITGRHLTQAGAMCGKPCSSFFILGLWSRQDRPFIAQLR